MYSGIPFVEQSDSTISQTPQREQEPVKNNAQPKPKSEGPGRLIQEMTQLASFLEQLRVQSHLIHFNYESSNFIGIHKFLKKQYELHQDQFDKVGELIRSMDYLLPMCMKGLLAAYKKFNHCESYDAKQMLITYYKNLEDFTMLAKKVRKLAEKEDAPDIDNYMAQLIEDSFKSSWYIKATLRE